MTKQQVLVIGLGRFGYSLATSLFDAGHEVLVLDRSEEAIESITSRSTAAFVGDAQETKTLESIGAKEFDVAVITFGENFESTVLATASLKAIGMSQIVARASTQRQAEVLLAVGAHRVLQLEADMGCRLAAELAAPKNPNLLELAAGYQAIPWTARASLVGQTLGQSPIYSKYHILVVGLTRADAPTDVGGHAPVRLPRADEQIQDGDTLLLVGEDEHLAAFFEQYGR